MNTQIQNVADRIDPETGRTCREDNAALVHQIPLGALVEINTVSALDGEHNGLRLFVVHRGRDCDQTPLYWLSHKTLEEYREIENGAEADRPGDIMAIYDKGYHAGCRCGGYSEQSLTVIRYPLGEPGLTYMVALISSYNSDVGEWCFNSPAAHDGYSQELFETDDLDAAKAFAAEMKRKHPQRTYRVIPFKGGQCLEPNFRHVEEE